MLPSVIDDLILTYSSKFDYQIFCKFQGTSKLYNVDTDMKFQDLFDMVCEREGISKTYLYDDASFYILYNGKIIRNDNDSTLFDLNIQSLSCLHLVGRLNRLSKELT